MSSCGLGLRILYAVDLVFFFIEPPTTDIYTLSLHDALPIFLHPVGHVGAVEIGTQANVAGANEFHDMIDRSEEHTSELQSLRHLVCRLLLEKKKKAR